MKSQEICKNFVAQPIIEIPERVTLVQTKRKLKLSLEGSQEDIQHSYTYFINATQADKVLASVVDYKTFNQHLDVEIEITACRRFLVLSKKDASKSKQGWFSSFRRQKYEFYAKVDLR